MDLQSQEELPMQSKMAPPPIERFQSREDLIKHIRDFSLTQGYVISIKRSEKEKRVVLGCDRGGTHRKRPNIAENIRRRERSSRLTNCPFEIHGRKNADGSWVIKIKNLEHNHEASEDISEHPSCRRFSEDEVLRIKEMTAAGIQPRQVLTALKQSNPKLLAASRNVYNIKAKIRRENLSVFGVTTPEEQDALKRALAKRAVEHVRSGMVIGLGTGTVSSFVVEELAKVIKQKKLKDVVGVGANYQGVVLAKQFGIQTVDLNSVIHIDIAFDGVDEVDVNKNLLKGGGAAHTMQKVIDSMAKECVILTDQSKVVLQLGRTFPVPVEVIPPAISHVLRRLVTLGGVPEIRSALRKDGPVITELGNLVVDVRFPRGIQDPAELEKSINMIPGVIENDIFSGVTTTVRVAAQDTAFPPLILLLSHKKLYSHLTVFSCRHRYRERNNCDGWSPRLSSSYSYGVGRVSENVQWTNRCSYYPGGAYDAVLRDCESF